MQSTIDFEARKLFEAIKYQIHVAIEYCHKLEDDQSLWIEVFGDVAVDREGAVEVKMWEDDLSDGHTNFWNTLHNWLKPAFDHERFEELVLLTTQSFGSRSTLSRWNESDPSQRLGLLTSINAAIGKRKPRKQESELPSDGTSPKQGKLTSQRKAVLSTEMRESLLAVIPKIRILPEQQNLAALIAAYKKEKLGGINPNRKDDYVNDLFGFMMDASRIAQGWEIKGREFNAKLQELTKRHMVGPVTFPTINTELISRQAAEPHMRSRRFARKLIEIGAEKHLSRATLNLLEAHEHVSGMIRDCSVSPEDISRYQDNHHEAAFWARDSAMEKLDTHSDRSTKLAASRLFFSESCAAPVTPLCSFQDTPHTFRNGIYHLLADEEPGTRNEEFHWRLWDE